MIKKTTKRLILAIAGLALLFAIPVFADRTFTLPPQTGHIGQFLQANGTSTGAWATAGGGGGMTIGDLVTDGIPNTILFVDGSGNLGDNENFAYTESGNSFIHTGFIPAIDAPRFTGTGLNDMNSGGAYTGMSLTKTYTVTIDSEGTPDTFTWDDGGTPVTGVPITGAPQVLNDGVEINFGSDTGHTSGDFWTFDATLTQYTGISSQPELGQITIGDPNAPRLALNPAGISLRQIGTGSGGATGIGLSTNIDGLFLGEGGGMLSTPVGFQYYGLDALPSNPRLGFIASLASGEENTYTMGRMGGGANLQVQAADGTVTGHAGDGSIFEADFLLGDSASRITHVDVATGAGGELRVENGFSQITNADSLGASALLKASSSNGTQGTFQNTDVLGEMSLDATQSKLEHTNTALDTEGGFAVSDAVTASSFVDNGDGTIAQNLLNNIKNIQEFLVGTTQARSYASADRFQSEFFDTNTDVATYNIQNAGKSELGAEDSDSGMNAYAGATTAGAYLRATDNVAEDTDVNVSYTAFDSTYTGATTTSSLRNDSGQARATWQNPGATATAVTSAENGTAFIQYSQASDTSSASATAAALILNAGDGSGQAQMQLKVDGSSTSLGRLWGTKGADVASTNNMTLGLDGTMFDITGTGTVNCIAEDGWQNGQQVVFHTTGSSTMADGESCGAGFLPLLLANTTDFGMGADYTLTLVKTATSFIELARMAR